MLNWVLWVFAFIGLWLALIWLSLALRQGQRPRLKTLPKISIAIPCHNEASSIAKTLKSLDRLAWPRQKLELLVVDDGSTDATADIVRSLQPKLRFRTLLLQQPNQGKAAALNSALEIAQGQYFGCVDADVCVEPKALAKMLPSFKPRTAAVLATVLPKGRGFWYILQTVEYALANMLRSLAAKLGMLGHVHGALTLFRKDVLKALGGFSEAALTEDIEIALRLRKAGWDIALADAKTWTDVPQSWSSLWRQRLRWYRGWLANHFNYIDMFANAKYGLFGLFQLPISFLSIALLIASIGILTYSWLSDSIEFAIRNLTIPGYFINHVLDFPGFERLLLGQNIQIYLPIAASAFVSLLLLVLAMQKLKLKKLLAIPIYVLAMPAITALHWLSSCILELLKTKRKW